MRIPDLPTEEDYLIYKSNQDGMIFVHCGHERLEQTAILKQDDPIIVYIMCHSCYERMIGHFSMELLKPLSEFMRRIK